MSTIKIPREQTQFIIVGKGQFLNLYPGQAQDSFGSKAFKIEVVVPPEKFDADKARLLAGQPAQESIVRACSIVAGTYDPANWFGHLFGPKGRIQKFEEKNRNAANNGHCVGQYVISLSAVWSNKQLGFENLNLTDPAERLKFDAALASKAPGAYKFCDRNNPNDVAYMEAKNLALRNSGHLPIQESDYHKHTIPIAAHEIWAGCEVAVAGRVYWNKNGKPATIGFGLDQVLLVRTGERLVGEASPDAIFSGFAPAAELAPPNPFGQIAPGFPPPPPPPQAPGGGLSRLF